MKRLALALAFSTVGLAGGVPMASATEIIVPAYFDPIASAAQWAQIAAAVDQGYKVTTIINPNSGPLPTLAPPTDAWKNVTASVNCGECGSALGFVYTRYGERPLAEVLADVRTYVSQGYKLSGIFVDEMPSRFQIEGGEGPRSADFYLDYYSRLYAGIKAIDPTFRVVGNPGINASEVFLSGNATYGKSADAVMVLENTSSILFDQTKYLADAWNLKPQYEGDIGYIIHSTPETLLADVLAKISVSGGDIVYVTDGSFLENGTDARYTQLTSYWNTLLASAEICDVPEPSSLALLGLGVAGLAWRRRRSNAA